MARGVPRGDRRRGLPPAPRLRRLRLQQGARRLLRRRLQRERLAQGALPGRILLRPHEQPAHGLLLAARGAQRRAPLGPRRCCRSTSTRASSGFSVERDGRALRVGLAYVKEMSRAAGAAIVAERAPERGGPYRSLADFCRRTRVSVEIVINLVRVGAFDAPRRAPRGAARAGAARARAGHGDAWALPGGLRAGRGVPVAASRPHQRRQDRKGSTAKSDRHPPDPPPARSTRLRPMTGEALPAPPSPRPAGHLATSGRRKRAARRCPRARRCSSRSTTSSERCPSCRRGARARRSAVELEVLGPQRERPPARLRARAARGARRRAVRPPAPGTRRPPRPPGRRARARPDALDPQRPPHAVPHPRRRDRPGRGRRLQRRLPRTAGCSKRRCTCWSRASCRTTTSAAWRSWRARIVDLEAVLGRLRDLPPDDRNRALKRSGEWLPKVEPRTRPGRTG